MRCCLPSCPAPRKVETRANNESKTAAGGRRFITQYLRTHTRVWGGKLTLSERERSPGKCGCLTFPRRGRTTIWQLYRFSLLREQGPNQNLVAQKLAHRAVGRFAALWHLDWYRRVLPPARRFRLDRLFRGERLSFLRPVPNRRHDPGRGQPSRSRIAFGPALEFSQGTWGPPIFQCVQGPMTLWLRGQHENCP